MILMTIAILGIFLLLASRNPSEHRGLISFAARSSLAHGLLMLVQALRDPMERGNLFGDIPALVLVSVDLVGGGQAAARGLSHAHF